MANIYGLFKVVGGCLVKMSNDPKKVTVSSLCGQDDEKNLFILYGPEEEIHQERMTVEEAEAKNLIGKEKSAIMRDLIKRERAKAIARAKRGPVKSGKRLMTQSEHVSWFFSQSVEGEMTLESILKGMSPGRESRSGEPMELKTVDKLE